MSGQLECKVNKKDSGSLKNHSQMIFQYFTKIKEV